MVTIHPLSNKELREFEIISKLIRREINGTVAGNLLGLSVRQVRRLKQRVQKFGAAGLVHGNRGKKSNHGIVEIERKYLVSLLKKLYHDFGPTFASEKLATCHSIHHDPKTIRNIMIEEGLWQPRRTKKELHRSWRLRRAHTGELIQYDGSYEYWFEDRADKCCLLLAVDDATGDIMHGEFSEHEGVFPTFTFWLNYVKKHGKPVSIYVDKFSTYKMTQELARDNHDLKTQFQRVCETLHIELIFAHSPQAKGRVENKFHTLQDRLIKELRLAGISDKLSANIFLTETFIPSYNIHFGVAPRSSSDLHSSLSPSEGKQLTHIFSKQTERTVQNDFTISFNTAWYQLIKDQPVSICKRDVVTVEEHIDDTIHFTLRGKYLNAQLISKRPNRTNSRQWIIPGKRPVSDISNSR